MVGTIGGGCYENDAFWKAREAITNRRPQLIHYELSDDFAQPLMPVMSPHSRGRHGKAQKNRTQRILFSRHPTARGLNSRGGRRRDGDGGDDDGDGIDGAR